MMELNIDALQDIEARSVSLFAFVIITVVNWDSSPINMADIKAKLGCT